MQRDIVGKSEPALIVSVPQVGKSLHKFECDQSLVKIIKVVFLIPGSRNDLYVHVRISVWHDRGTAIREWLLGGVHLACSGVRVGGMCQTTAT